MKTHLKLKSLFAAVAGLVVAGVSQAAIVSASSTVELLSNAPTSVVAGKLESNDKVRAFNEQQGLVLLSTLAVDALAPLLNGASTTTAGNIAAGTRIDSHFLHYDRVGEPSGGAVGRGGTVEFSGAILGLIFQDSLLNTADSLLGAAGTAYPTGAGGRRFFFENNDWYRVSDDRLSITFTAFVNRGGIDQFRVITAAANDVPEPGSLALAGLALCAAGAIGARRRRTA